VSYVPQIGRTDDYVLSDSLDARTRAMRSVEEKRLLIDRRLRAEFVDLLSSSLKLLEPENNEYAESLVRGVAKITGRSSLLRAMSHASIPQVHVIAEEIADAVAANFRCLDSEERLPDEELRRLSIMMTPKEY
jgi:hypothetical protein